MADRKRSFGGGGGDGGGGAGGVSADRARHRVDGGGAVRARLTPEEREHLGNATRVGEHGGVQEFSDCKTFMHFVQAMPSFARRIQAQARAMGARSPLDRQRRACLFRLQVGEVKRQASAMRLAQPASNDGTVERKARAMQVALGLQRTSFHPLPVGAPIHHVAARAMANILVTHAHMAGFLERFELRSGATLLQTASMFLPLTDHARQSALRTLRKNGEVYQPFHHLQGPDAWDGLRIDGEGVPTPVQLQAPPFQFGIEMGSALRVARKLIKHFMPPPIPNYQQYEGLPRYSHGLQIEEIRTSLIPELVTELNDAEDAETVSERMHDIRAAIIFARAAFAQHTDQLPPPSPTQLQVVTCAWVDAVLDLWNAWPRHIDSWMYAEDDADAHLQLWTSGNITWRGRLDDTPNSFPAEMQLAGTSEFVPSPPP